MENLKIANMQAETEEKTTSKPKRKYTRRTTSSKAKPPSQNTKRFLLWILVLAVLLAL